MEKIKRGTLPPRLQCLLLICNIRKWGKIWPKLFCTASSIYKWCKNEILLMIYKSSLKRRSACQNDGMHKVRCNPDMCITNTRCRECIGSHCLLCLSLEGEILLSLSDLLSMCVCLAIYCVHLCLQLCFCLHLCLVLLLHFVCIEAYHPMGQPYINFKSPNKYLQIFQQ